MRRAARSDALPVLPVESNQYLPACSARALHVCMCRMRIHGARYNGSTGTVVPVPVLGIPTMILDLVDLFEYIVANRILLQLYSLLHCSYE